MSTAQIEAFERNVEIVLQASRQMHYYIEIHEFGTARLHCNDLAQALHLLNQFANQLADEETI